MVIIREYRLEEQGGFIFRKEQRNAKLPDMRGETVYTVLARTSAA